jgi:hypothetical protein
MLKRRQKEQPDPFYIVISLSGPQEIKSADQYLPLF